LKPYEYLVKTSQESIEIQQAFLQEAGEKIIAAAQLIGQSIKNGGKVLIFGNGGSAADAQHMAAEMVGRMLVHRRSLPAIALTTDSSNLTAVGNDFGYEHVFSRQVQALGRKGDVIVAISTSGTSRNVVAAIHEAKSLGCRVIGLTGGEGGEVKQLSDICLCATRGVNSSRIQESHIFAIHSMVDILDRYFLEDPGSGSRSSECS
jgi:D-sedoheptulose 7-phosphate isomerase